MKAKLTDKFIRTLTPATKAYEVRDTDLIGFFLRVQPTGKMVYWVDYRLPGRGRNRYRIETQGKITAAAARSVAMRLLAEVAHGKDIQAEKKRARREREKAKLNTLRAFLTKRYGPWATAQLKTGEDAVKRIETNFAHLLDRPLSNINLWDIEKWRSEQRRAGKAPSTINRDVVALRSLLSRAVEWGVLDDHPLRSLKPLKTDRQAKVRYLSSDEEKGLRQALDQRERQIREKRLRANHWRAERGYSLMPDLTRYAFADHLKPMVLLSMNTGLRRGELFSLTWGNADLTNALITVEGPKAKSHLTRHIPLNDEALNTLKLWRDQGSGTGYVFAGSEGRRFDNIRNPWLSALRIAGVSGFRWHDLRHHFASRLVMSGVDLNTVRELLGHSEMTMTLRYAHLAAEHKAEAVQRLEDRRA